MSTTRGKRDEIGLCDFTGYQVHKTIIPQISQTHREAANQNSWLKWYGDLKPLTTIDSAAHPFDKSPAPAGTRAVWEWISDLPPIGAGDIHPDVLNHRAANSRRLYLQAFLMGHREVTGALQPCLPQLNGTSNR
jgi:hypothetical protein